MSEVVDRTASDPLLGQPTHPRKATELDRERVRAFIRTTVEPPRRAPAPDDGIAASVRMSDWQPPSSRRLRAAEAVVASAIMGYFFFGLISVLVAG
jgi:hypothetical protein